MSTNNAIGSRILVDSNVLVGLYNKTDSLHQKSRSLMKKLESLESALFVTNYILLELYTVISQRVGKPAALKFGEDIKREKPFTGIIWISEEKDEKTWEIFKKVKNKDVSFVDCNNIAIALEEDLKIATFDKNLIKLQKDFGFEVLI